MRRREFISALGAATFLPLASAQQAGRVRRIGVLQGSYEDDPEWQRLVAAFVDGLRARGWMEGANILIHYRWGNTDSEQVRRYATELVNQQSEVIWAAGSIPVLSLKRATRTIPIVFTQIFDPVSSGFVASLARPGGNVTGFSLGEFSMGGKMLEILKEVAPQLSRVAVILNLDQPPHVALYHTIETLGPSIGVTSSAVDAQDRAEIERAIPNFANAPNGGLVVLPGPITVAHRDLIVAAAAKHHLPAIYPFRYFVTGGGLVSYGADPVAQSAAAAAYVDRILRGEKPAELPVQTPTKFALVVNLMTAKALGLTLPPSLLARADEVIE